MTRVRYRLLVFLRRRVHFSNDFSNLRSFYTPSPLPLPFHRTSCNSNKTRFVSFASSSLCGAESVFEDNFTFWRNLPPPLLPTIANLKIIEKRYRVVFVIILYDFFFMTSTYINKIFFNIHVGSSIAVLSIGLK